MRFARQLAAAAVAVAVVVLIGLAWSHLAPTLPGEGPVGHAFAVRGHLVKVLPPGGKPPQRGRLPPAGVPGTRRNDGYGIPGLMLGDLLEPVNLAVLRNNAVLEAAVIAAVVILDVGYRRLRRARRGRTAGGPAGPAC